MDIVVSSPDVELCEDLGLRETVDDVGGEWERVTIFDCDRVELSVVLYEVKLSVLLFDKKRLVIPSVT